ncbi:hypothetical protein Ga0100231_005350 [Opitutaceae bacterium TAV4]|nr:hypothetical protein Ga0100231_005350 [Opitutaceae bacterium TAV4]RRK02589.1 hypothetical protein Ga0100230_005600 [Opitutaceae bacterium TAV3]
MPSYKTIFDLPELFDLSGDDCVEIARPGTPGGNRASLATLLGDFAPRNPFLDATDDMGVGQPGNVLCSNGIVPLWQMDLTDGEGIRSAGHWTRELYDLSGYVVAINWQERIAYDAYAVGAIDWTNRILYNSEGGYVAEWGEYFLNILSPVAIRSDLEVFAPLSVDGPTTLLGGLSVVNIFGEAILDIQSEANPLTLSKLPSDAPLSQVIDRVNTLTDRLAEYGIISLLY